uniref:Uncharacterized protein n=1 Tax=Oryza barthii TaxID=65489 RepID=A0A0D3FWN5_9ORYZ
MFTMILLPTRRSKGMERARAYVYMRCSAASVKYSLCFTTQVVVRCTDAVARWPGVKVQRYEYDRTVDEPDVSMLDRLPTGRIGLLTQLMGLAFARPRCRIWQQAYLHSLDGPQQRFISTSKPQRPADLINRYTCWLFAC